MAEHVMMATYSLYKNPRNGDKVITASMYEAAKQSECHSEATRKIKSVQASLIQTSSLLACYMCFGHPKTTVPFVSVFSAKFGILKTL